MRTRVLALILAVLVEVLPVAPASSNSSTQAFKAYLNGLHMDAILPLMAMKDVFVGGLVAAKGNNADFKGLPTGVNQPTATGGDPQVFPAQSSKSSLSLKIALNALFGWMIGGNLSHGKNLNINQIDATFYTSSGNSDALNDPKTQNYVKDLIETQHLKVYQVQALSTTKAINFTTSSSLGAGITVTGGNSTGAQATNCTSNSGNSTGNGSQGTNNGNATSSTGSAQHATQTPTTGATPGGSLQLCTSSDTSLSLTTPNDLVFGVKVYEVTLDPTTHTYMAGAMPVSASSGAYSDLMSVPHDQLKNNDVRRLQGGAAGLNSKWTIKKQK